MAKKSAIPVRATKELPGPKAKDVVRRDSAVLSPYNRPFYYPMVADSAEGCIVRDSDGNEFLDLNSGLGVMNVGHSHPKVVEAITKQVNKLIHYSYTDFYYPYAVDLAEKLITLTPGKFSKKVFFSGSGAESGEAAIKAAKWHTKRGQFLGYIGAFHGRTMGVLSFTASSLVQKARYFPTMPGVTHLFYPYCYRCPFKLEYPECDFHCVDYIDDWILRKFVPPQEVAALLLEPIQGEGGYIPPPPGYWQRIEKLLRPHGILLIDDEVQAGMGRTGKWCAMDHWGVIPDIVTMSKAMASGISLGATIARTEVFDWEPGAHCTTLGGNPVACAASLAAIDVIEKEHLLENATKQGEHCMKRFREFEEDCPIVGDVRGKGLMIGVEVVADKKSKKFIGKNAKSLITRAWKKGLIAITAGESTIRIAPPLIITREQMDFACDVLQAAMMEEAKEMGAKR